MNLIEVQPEQLQRILAQIRAGHVVASGQGQTHTQLLRAATDSLGDGAVLVRVARNLDAAPYVALSIAAQCGPDVLRRTAGQLADPHAPADAWQAGLTLALAGRSLFVEGLDLLRTGGPEWDAAGLFAPAFQSLDAWLSERSAILPGGDAPPCELSPKDDARVATERLWARVGRDPERYALAVAREILLGPADDDEGGWDSGSLVRDLWEGMPSEMRELVAFLAVHGRPVPRDLFERLALVPVGSVGRAQELALIESHRDQLSLPAPWYDAVPWLDPIHRHRVLADAFATQSQRDDGGASPLAVLEAHRHYAAIPDHERALAFARFGAGALLDTAVRQSLRREPAEAVKTYEALIQLDERIVAAQRVEGLGKRTRAYVRHYLHFNRYLADRREPLEATISGYRGALEDWPENALFWSRLVRALFVAEDEAGAMSALHEAYLAVPRHPERDRVLILRTVDRLLSREHGDLVLPAVFVWGEHRGRGRLDSAVEGRLDARLGEGWQARRLWIEGVPAVDVDPPASMKMIVAAGSADLECVADDLVRRGKSRADAVRAAVRARAFEELATRWRRETGGLSVVGSVSGTSGRYRHPAMQHILAMGREVVPEILRRLEREPDHWHPALAQLTGDSPFAPGEKVTVSQACVRWMAWGRARGLSW